MVVNILILGLKGVGKTALIHKLINGSKCNSNVRHRFPFRKYNLYINQTQTSLTLIDTPSFDFNAPTVVTKYFPLIHVILIIFDVSVADSYETSLKILQLLQSINCNCYVFIIGNKCDTIANRHISNAQLVSAKTGTGINELLSLLLTTINPTLPKIIEWYKKQPINEQERIMLDNYGITTTLDTLDTLIKPQPRLCCCL